MLLLMSTFPHIFLTTHPTINMGRHGSINYQKSLASSVGTSMLINITGNTTSLQRRDQLDECPTEAAYSETQ